MTTPTVDPFGTHAKRLASTLIPGEPLSTEASRLADAMTHHIVHDLVADPTDHHTIRQSLIEQAIELATKYDDSTRQAIAEWHADRIKEIWDDYVPGE